MTNATHAISTPLEKSSNATTRPKFTLQEFVGCSLVVLGAILINYNYPNRLDIISDDDDLYFSFGMMLLKGKYRGADDGPLYYVFQLLLQLVTNDAIRTFYVNYIVTTTVPMLLFYSLLRARQIALWPAVWITLMFMFSNLNYPLTPKLTHYAVIFLMLGLLAFTYAEGMVRKLFFASLFTLLASYVRPELYIAFFLLALGTSFECYRQKIFIYALLLIGITLASGYLLGTPIGANDRSFWTFKHHFSINYIETHPELNLSPWNHFNQITTDAFGHKLTSVKDAILTNPQLVLWHIRLNIVNYFKALPHHFINIFFDSIQFPFRKYVLLALGLFALARTDYRKTWKNLSSTLRSNFTFLTVFLTMLAPTFISNFFIYPRTHYILYHFFFYLYIVGILCNSVWFRSTGKVRPARVKYILSGVHLLFIILLFVPKYRQNAEDKPLPSREFALMLRNCHLKGPVFALGGDAPFSYNRYVGLDWTFYYFDIIRPKSLERCLTDFNVNCVITNSKMDKYFDRDPTYREFLASPDKWKFVLVHRTTDHRIYARREIL